jgi:hypothetical protein
MFDIGLSWFDLALLSPLILPWLAVPGALLAGYIAQRRRRNPYVSLGAAALGCFALPWAVLAAAFVLDRGRSALSRLGGAGAGALLLGAAVGIVLLVLLGVSRAGARRRRD